MPNQILPLSWQYFIDTATRARFVDINRLRAESDAVHASFPDTAPFCFDTASSTGGTPTQGITLLIMRGTLTPGEQGRVDMPPVVFAVTLRPNFPNEHPVITIEQPPAGFAIKQHRHVGQDGTCFLESVSRWTAGGSSISLCLFELRGHFERQYPFEATTVQPPHAAPPPPPAAAAPAPVPAPGPTPMMGAPYQGGQYQQPNPYQQQQPPHHYQQQAPIYSQPPPPPPPPQPAVAPPPPRQQPPPPTGTAEAAFGALLTAVFTVGEEELSRAGGSIPFHSMDERWRCIDRWCYKAVSMCVSRRPGEAHGIELATGSILPESAVVHSPELHALYRLVVTAQVSGRSDDIKAAVEAFMHVPSFRDRMANTSALLSDMYCPQSPLSMDKVWASFFSSAFRVGEEALQRGDLAARDVMGQEPWLYLGLTAATALDTLLRSPKHGPLRLAFGERDVTPDNLPPEGQPLLDAFMQLRDSMVATNLSPADLSLLQRKALWSDRDDRDLQVPPHVARLAGGLHSIACRASQEPRFKSHFQQTLELLSAIATS